MSKESDKTKSLIHKLAHRFAVEPTVFFETLKTQAFKKRDGSPPTNQQMLALMVVANEYGLNPFLKELYAFEGKGGDVVPVVSVDGWSRIVNEHPAFDGIDFVYSEQMSTPPGGQSCYEWIEARIHRKDRKRPVTVREHLDEAYVPAKTWPGPWQTHTKRMLRHRAFIQCARVAFGFGGIYEQDEARAIAEGNIVSVQTPQPSIEHLEEVASNLKQRVAAMGVAPIEAMLRQRYQGEDLDYLLTSIKAESTHHLVDQSTQPEAEEHQAAVELEQSDAEAVDDIPGEEIPH